MKAINRYGVDIQVEEGELSEDTKNKLPECIGCWDNKDTFSENLFYCGHYGACNLYPFLTHRWKFCDKSTEGDKK